MRVRPGREFIGGTRVRRGLQACLKRRACTASPTAVFRIRLRAGATGIVPTAELWERVILSTARREKFCRRCRHGFLRSPICIRAPSTFFDLQEKTSALISEAIGKMAYRQPLLTVESGLGYL